ncbi:MAG: hypothetical protein CMN30_24095 [Sandaracinus sp.]|nr:hypothetical protein [Sandaracinus sp.]
MAVAGALALAWMQIPASPERLVRDAVTFGAAGCLAAPTARALLEGSGLSERAVRSVRAAAVLDDVAGIALLALLSAFQRPERATTWSLPGIGWRSWPW